MTEDLSFECPGCGERHPLPFAYGVAAPVHWLSHAYALLALHGSFFGNPLTGHECVADNDRMEVGRALRRITILGWAMLLMTGIVLVDMGQAFIGAAWTDIPRRALIVIAGIAIGWIILQGYFLVTGYLMDRNTILGYVVVACFLVGLWTLPAALMPEPLFLGGMVGLFASWYPHCWQAVGIKERQNAELEQTLPLETSSRPAA